MPIDREIKPLKVKTPEELLDKNVLLDIPLKGKLERIFIKPIEMGIPIVGFWEKAWFYTKQLNIGKILQIGEIVLSEVPVVGSILRVFNKTKGVIMPTTESKPFWQSKMLWVNVIVIVASFFGVVEDQISPEMMVVILGVVNFILRLVTKSSVTIS